VASPCEPEYLLHDGVTAQVITTGSSATLTLGLLQCCPLFTHKGPFIAPNLATKICFDFCPARMSRPIGRCSPPENVLQIQSCTPFDEEPDYIIVPSPGSLVQRCRVGMASHRVVSVWIFARVKQQPNDIDMTKIRCQSKCQLAVLRVGPRKQPTGIFDAPQGRCHRQIDSSAAPDQSVHRFELAVQGRCLCSAVGIRSVIAQEIDQRKLQATFTRYTPSRDEHERLVLCGLARPSIENDLGHLNDVRRQSAMTNRILSNEFQQRWIPKVVPAFENDVLMHKIRMLIQVRAQTNYVTCIEEFHGAAKWCIFNSLLVRQIQSIGERWFFDVTFQPRPARKSIFAGDCKLRVTEAEMGVEDFSVHGPTKTRVKFPDPLGYSRSVGGTLF
jgi:hypothetical protein